MSDFLVLASVSLSGLAIAGDRRFGLGPALAAPIVGTAGYLVATAVLVGFEAFTVGRALALVAVLAAGVLVATIRRSPGPVDWRSAGLAAIGVLGLVAVVVAVTWTVPLTRLSPDSGRYLILARILGETGSLAEVGVPLDLLKRQLAVAAIHVVGADGLGYSPSWTPLLAVSGVATTVHVAWSRLRPSAGSAAALATIVAAPLVLLLSADRTLFNLTYLNGHLLFAVLLLFGVARLWDAAERNERWGLLAAGLCFAALLTIRAESAIVVAIFLLPLVLSPAWDLRERLTIVAAPVVVAVSWYGLAVRPHVTADSLGITGPVDSVFVVIGGIVAAAVAASWFRPLALRRLAVVSMGVVLTGYLLWNLAVLPDDMATTLGALAANLTTEGLWGITWPILAVLVAGVFVSRFVPDDMVFAAGLPLYGLALVAFAFLREDPYVLGPGGSGNRMVFHVGLVAVLYVMLGAGRAAAGDPRAS